MKKRIFIASLILAAATCLAMVPSLLAQGQRTQLTPEERVANMEKAITLTADQKAQLIKIYTDMAANAQGGGGGRGGGFGGMGGGMLPESIQKVLTPDQVKKYTAFQRQTGIDNTINRIDQAVTLTADQKKKIEPIIAKQVDAQAKFMAEQRAAGGTPDMDTMRAKMTELRDAMVKELSGVLSKEQMDKYNAMPRGGRGGGGRGNN